MAADTLRITGAGCVLIGPEGRTPPLPFITVDAGEGNALIRQKLATLYTGTAEAALVSEPTPEPEPEVTEPEASEPETPAEEPAAEEPTADEPEASADPVTEPETAPENASAPEGGEGGTEGETREEMLIAALDLMEAGDLVKTGDRAGKPKLAAMEAATGLTDLTADEIDAAVAAKEAAEVSA